ncbi:MAG: serine protease [Bdellovibrionota bacterium]
MGFIRNTIYGLMTALIFVSTVLAEVTSVNDKDQSSKSIYGQDNRQEPYEVKDEQIEALSRATAAIFPVYRLRPHKKGFTKASIQSVGQVRRLCIDEKFRDQPAGPYCSGVLVGKDVVLTSGHCVKLGALACWGINIIFDYRKDTPERNPWIIDNKNIYSCAKIISTSSKDGLDYALIRLDRPVQNRKPIEVEVSLPAVQSGDRLVMLGHPFGLPQKIVTEGTVRSIGTANFLTNLDALYNSSGSPVFSAQNKLIGLLVTSKNDLIYDEKKLCNNIKRCEDNNCEGEVVQSIEPLVKLIHQIKTQ